VNPLQVLQIFKVILVLVKLLVTHMVVIRQRYRLFFTEFLSKFN